MADEKYTKAAGIRQGNKPEERAARHEVEETTLKESGSANQAGRETDEQSDALAHRDPAQAQDYKGESQNVNDDFGRPLSDEEARKGAYKASEGKDLKEEK